MKTLLIGSTGLLGQALTVDLRARNWALRTAARSGADLALDIADAAALARVLEAEAPDLVINSAALVDIARCEADPAAAYLINARPAAFLADWSQRTGGRFLQISTDHYFNDGSAARHGEDEPVTLLNEYARTKFAAERFALNATRALVLRTSIVGISGRGRSTFAEWAIAAVLANQPVRLFTDAYTSSIDVGTFARAAIDMVAAGAAGLFNLAANDVYPKERFVREIAAWLELPLDHVSSASVQSLDPPRATSLGLDVSRAQTYLDFPLPTLSQVVEAVLRAYRQRMAK